MEVIFRLLSLMVWVSFTAMTEKQQKNHWTPVRIRAAPCFNL